MTERVNPSHVKYIPETLPEAITTTASASGANIASYAAFKPNIIIVKSLFTDVAEDLVLRLDKDSSYGTLEVENTCRSDREESKLDIPCTTSMNLWAVGANTEIGYISYTMKITQPTIFEKIKYELPLSLEETEISDQFEIMKKYSAGLLKEIDTPIFSKIVEIAKKVTVAAGSNTRVGSLINVKSGQKAVILSIATDNSHGALSADDTFITVNRDISDKSYVKLDTVAMPDLNHDINCYIPGINRLEVILESVTGVTDMPVRYRYAVSDITILENIRWFGSDAPLTAKQLAIATELDLFNAVSAGIM